MRPFEFSGYSKFQDQPCVHPGKIFDRSDQDGSSYVPQGGPAPYGRVLVRGAGVLGTDLASKHHTLTDTCSLPDKDGAYLKADDGQTYADAGVSLPVNAAGLLMVLGVGMFTEHTSPLNSRLAQPFGLGDLAYQSEKCGQVGVAEEGRIWAYCETDINVGDDLFFRTVVTSTDDGVQLLGAFSNVGGANFQPFTHGSVFRGGPAGGAFVVNLNVRN